MILQIAIRWELLLQIIAILPFIVHVGSLIVYYVCDNHRTENICTWVRAITSGMECILYFIVCIIKAWQHTIELVQLSLVLLVIWFIVIIISAYKLGED